MQRLTKAAVATGAAAVLLLGGAQTLAFWTAEGTATGPAIDSGSFALTDSECDPDWTLDGGAPLGAAPIVPGDSLTISCTYTIDGTGGHLTLESVTAEEPAWTVDNAFTDELTLDDAEVSQGGSPATLPMAIDGPETFDVLITVLFDGPGATNGSQSTDTTTLTATLDAITVTFAQGHSAA